MINEVEEGARETVTAEVRLQVSPEYGGALRRGCGIYPRRGPTLPDSLNTVPLSLQREDDRESVDFHVYADMYFKTSISTDHDCGSDAYGITFDSQ